ncbi:MAG: YkgJ family cysteine cluster protein [Chloroflexota bacterium]
MPEGYVTDLDALPGLVEQQRDVFEVMGHMLEIYEDIPDDAVDRIVAEVAEPVRAGIDCTACGNCCKRLQVHVTPSDVEVLAAGIHLPIAEVHERYLTDEGCAEIEEWRKFNQQPCAFLDGERCSVYAHRPETCRAYPELTDFRWLIDTYIEGAKLCPIIYNTLVAMVVRVDAL